jgi:uncharacterized protein
VDINGWFEVKDNPISKVGVFPYAGTDLPDAPDRNKTYSVYRPADELGAPDFIASLRLVPWINDHEVLGSAIGGKPADQYGVAGVVGQDSWFDGSYVRSNIKIFSEAMAKDIGTGKSELSLGYQCSIDWTPGTFDGKRYDCIQRDLRANHLALVDQGRMGPEVAVLDHGTDRLTITADSLEYKMPDTPEQKTEPTIAELMAAVMALTEKVNAMAAPAADADEPDKDAAAKADEEAAKAADEEKDKPAADEDKEKVAAMDAAVRTLNKRLEDQDKLIKAMQDSAVKSVAMDSGARLSLVEKAKPYIGVFAHGHMTHGETVAYVTDKMVATGMPKPAAGTEAIALDAYFAGLGKAPALAIATDSKPKEGGVIHKYMNSKE